MNRVLMAAGLMLLTCSVGQAQTQVRKLVLTPMAPGRALRYPLLPDLNEQKPGNAAPLYRAARQTLQKQGLAVNDPNGQRIQEWLESPGRLRAELVEARDYFAVLRPALDEIAAASRCERCDWEVFARLRETGELDFSDVQRIRYFAHVLQGDIVVALADNRVEDAIRDVRVVFSMARHIQSGPTIIHCLVGAAITGIANGLVERIIQHPKAPNLYWSLADLPSPVFNLRDALQGERVSFDHIFPGLSEAARSTRQPLTEEQMSVLVKRLDQYGILSGRDGRRRLGQIARFLPGLEMVNLPVEGIDRVRTAVDIQRKHDSAKKALVARGWPVETVDRLPPLQVALLHALPEYERDLDEMRVLVALPYWEAEPRLRQLETRLQFAEREAALPLGRELLPIITKSLYARARVDRQSAVLRCVEAIRLHAAAHGSLPRSLADIKEVPIPTDPVTGGSFDYVCDGKKATLKARRLSWETPLVAPDYELTFRR